MSRTFFPARAIFSAATLTAMLMGTACSDSTGPSTGEGSGGDSPNTQLPGGATAAPGDNSATPADTTTMASTPPKVAFAVVTNTSGYTGSVWAPKAGCYSPGAIIPRSLNVSGLKATDAPGSPFADQRIIAEVFLVHFEGGNWIRKVKRTVYADVHTYAVAASLPSVSFPLTYAGYYRVQVRFSWYGPNNSLQGTKWVDLNTAGDYVLWNGSRGFPGYCYIY
jgi:hypothetical protein